MFIGNLMYQRYKERIRQKRRERIRKAMNLDQGLIVRLIVCGLALLNAVMDILGLPHLEIADAQVTQVVNVVLLVTTYAWGFWKNNNFTEDAKASQIILNELKETNAEDIEIETFEPDEEDRQEDEDIKGYILIKTYNQNQ